MKDALLFWCHRGSGSSGKPKGIIMEGHCLPLATLLPQSDDDGIAAMIGEDDEVGRVFDLLGIDSTPVGGPWVYEIEWQAGDMDESADDDEDRWVHLRGGKVRMATAQDLSSLVTGLGGWYIY